METNQTNKGAATVSPVTQIEELSKRLERAREIVGEGHVSPVVGKDGQYVVLACKGGYYLVSPVGRPLLRGAQ